MEKLLKLTRSEGLRQSALVMGGTFFATGFSAIAIILISRILGPATFGEFSVGFALALILNRFNDLGLSFALQKFAARETTIEQKNKLFSFATRIKLLAFLFICIIGILVYLPLSRLLNFSQPLIILAAFVFSAGTTAYEHLQAILQSLHRFSQSVIANILQAILKTLGAIGFYFFSLKNSTLIFSYYLLAPLLPVFLSLKLVPSWFKIQLNQDFIKEKKLLTSIASHASIAYLSAGIIENIDILLVQKYLNTFEAGLLGGVSRIALLFSLVAYSLGTVLNPRVARYREKIHLQKFIKKASLIAALSLIGFLSLIPISKWMLIFTIGPDYLSGLNILNLLLASSFLTIAVIPFIAMFFSFEADWYFSVSGAAQLIMILAGNLIFVPIYGLPAAAWTRLITRLSLFIFTSLLAFYLYHREYVAKKT